MDADKVGGWFEVTTEMLEDAELGMTLVEELPEKGRKDTIYLVPKELYASEFHSDEIEIVDAYFEQYAMIDDEWCLVGTLKISQDDTEVEPHNLVPLRNNEVR